MTSSSHQVKFLFEKVDGETKGDVFALSKTLEHVLTDKFGPIRHDVRRDISQVANVCLVASFDFSIDASKISDSVSTTDADFWLDPIQWHGYKCISAQVVEVFFGT